MIAYRIHITSSGPRTGTTLLTEVFKSCFEIDCYCDHEAPLAKSNSSYGNCKVVLSKLPSSTKNLLKILDLFKNIYVVCLVRDPRDMIVSRHGRIPDLYYCGLNFWFEFLRDYSKLKNHPRFILVKYEDFTSNPDKVQESIETRLLFLNRKHRFSEYHLHSKPNKDSLFALKEFRPIESKGIGAWLDHLPRVKQQLDKHGDVSESLILFDYEQNNDWMRKLLGVKHKNYDSYKSEKFAKSSKREFLLTVFNFCCERLYLNPDNISSPIKFIYRIFQKRIN